MLKKKFKLLMLKITSKLRNKIRCATYYLKWASVFIASVILTNKLLVVEGLAKLQEALNYLWGHPEFVKALVLPLMVQVVFTYERYGREPEFAVALRSFRNRQVRVFVVLACVSFVFYSLHQGLPEPAWELLRYIGNPFEHPIRLVLFGWSVIAVLYVLDQYYPKPPRGGGY
jgi:hypothetical protein